jgi:hypothetical protein
VWLDTLSTADRVNLLELYGRSVMLLELGRASDWVDLFEPGALLRCGTQEFKGRSGLLEFAQRAICGECDLAAGQLGAATRCRHTLSDLSLFGEGSDGASGFAHVTVVSIDATNPPRWRASGTYADKLRKCGAGCWLFEKRELTLDLAGPQAFVAGERSAAVTAS